MGRSLGYLWNEPLQPTPVQGLANQQMAFQIDIQVVRRLELAGPSPSLTPYRQHVERFPIECGDLGMCDVEDEHISLLRVARQHEIVDRFAAHVLAIRSLVADEL